MWVALVPFAVTLVGVVLVGWINAWLGRPLTPTDEHCGRVDAELDGLYVRGSHRAVAERALGEERPS